MKPIHNREKDQFKKLFKQEHIDSFEDRFKILEVFLQTERHVTPNELVQLLSDRGYNFKWRFVQVAVAKIRRNFIEIGWGIRRSILADWSA